MRVRALAAGLLGLPAAGTLSLVAAARRQRRRHRPLVERVAPELRTKNLDLPFSVRTRWHAKLLRRLLAAPGPVAPDVTVTERHVGPDGAVRVVVHRPHLASGASLLWMHGGGLVAGRAETNNAMCSWLAATMGITVVAVDYRLAPEHPFPAALDDCRVALDWLHDASAELGLDPDRLAIGGVSAGGGLAATLAQRALDELGPSICAQLLVSPMLDDRTVLRPVSRQPWLVWTPASNRYGWTAYLGRRPRESDDRRYISAARRADLTGLPPAWIGVGDLDLFHDEAVDYAARLRAVGVPVVTHVGPGLYHGADSSFPDATETTRAFRSSLQTFLRSYSRGTVPFDMH